MTDNYEKIVQDNLKKLYHPLSPDLDQRIGATQEGDRFMLHAFGEPCVIAPDRITLGKETAPSIQGLLISLYALHASTENCVRTRFRAFKEFKDSMPYAGAFATHTEQVLAPHVTEINHHLDLILSTLQGTSEPAGISGDTVFLVHPLPKIALCYILYEADEDFPASVTCLYSSNADQFIPIDGLADTGEYTSKKILGLVTG